MHRNKPIQGVHNKYCILLICMPILPWKEIVPRTIYGQKRKHATKKTIIPAHNPQLQAMIKPSS